MKKEENIKLNLKLFAWSCIISILLGVALHFVYDILNKPFIIGLFIPVNESIWEHLKLVLLPITTFGILYNIFYRKESDKLTNFWYYTTKSIILSMIVIVFGYYGYRFIFKEVPGLVNIIIYIIAMILAFYKTYINLQNQNNNSDNSNVNKNSVGITILVLMFMLFILFTIWPPQIELFRDPVNNTFGIFMLE